MHRTILVMIAMVVAFVRLRLLGFVVMAFMIAAVIPNTMVVAFVRFRLLGFVVMAFMIAAVILNTMVVTLMIRVIVLHVHIFTATSGGKRPDRDGGYCQHLQDSRDHIASLFDNVDRVAGEFLNVRCQHGTFLGKVHDSHVEIQKVRSGFEHIENSDLAH
jgi:hypothetical protein